MDLSQLKRRMQLKTAKHDEYLEEILPDTIEFAKDYCNDSFLVDGEEVLPAGVKLFIAEAIAFNMQPKGLTSRSMGSVSYGYAQEYPRSITQHLSPYRKVAW